MPTSASKQRPNGHKQPVSNRIGFGTLFGPHSPEQCPDWRCRIAEQVARQAIDNHDDTPPTHEDGYIHDVARLIHAMRRKDQDFRPTLRQWHILQAFTLRKRGMLAVTVLETRLASRQSPEEIARTCSLDPQTIAAYAALLCDLSEPPRQHVWNRQRLMPSFEANKHVDAIDALLQRRLMLGGLEAVEQSIAVLCRLEGPTMAAGLPELNTRGFVQELIDRLDLAQVLLPRGKTAAGLMERLEIARRHRSDQSGMSDEAIDIGYQVLAKAKIPKPLQKEIDQLRAFCQPAEGTACQASHPAAEAHTKHSKLPTSSSAATGTLDRIGQSQI